MKIKLGSSKVFTSEDGPIMVILTDQDKENIKNMNPDAHKYCEYDNEKHSPEEISKWMREVNCDN